MALKFSVGIFAGLVGSTVAVGAPSVTQRIDHIQHDLLPPVLVTGQPVHPTELADRMNDLHVPGVSIAVIRDGKLEWARGFGVTRLGGPPVTAETLFQAASISKPVFATAVMSLVQGGKLNLDAPINGYLKSWQLPASDFTRETNVTLRELLTHSGGISVHGFAGYQSGAPLPTLVQTLDGAPPANNDPIRVVAPPGKEANYSGGGFIIAQQVVSDVTGSSLPKLMHDLVLAPFGMKSSTYEQPLPHDLLEHVAIPYRQDGSPVPGGPHVYPELAAAGLWTTPTDLARYAMGMQQALAGKSGRVLSAATAHAMLTPVFGSQAIGLRMGGTAVHATFSHGGANAGYRCILIAYEAGDGVVVMTNGDNGDAVMDDLVRTIAHEYGWPDYQPPVRTVVALNPGAFGRYAGAYRLPSGRIVTFWRDGGAVNARIWGDPPVQLYPSSEREYFALNSDLRWVFTDGVQGGADSVATLYQPDSERSARRLPDSEGPAAVQASIALAKRYSQQMPDGGSEAALLKMIRGLASGRPDYGSMVPELAELIRPALPGLQAALIRLGNVQSMALEKVEASGNDVYLVKFAAGAREFSILMDPDSRIHAAYFEP